jgi:5-methylcytosine-specific restriction enzyme subunit McrC
LTRRLSVATWGTHEYALTPAEAVALQATGLVDVEVGPAPGTYRLRGGTAVGVAAGPGWELHVESHLAAREIMFLLTYVRDPKGWRAAYAHFHAASSLFAAAAWGFAATAEDALRLGPLRGYRRLEEVSPVLRGRMLVAEQVARGGLPAPVSISRDEYDVDVLENRILLTAARLLVRLPLTAPAVRARLRRIAGLLDGAQVLYERREMRLPAITRLNRHYEPALVLAGLILEGLSVGSRMGTARSVTFAFELHRVFEDFLQTALDAAIRRRGGNLLRQPTGHALDAERTLHLEPDFVVTRDGRALSVLDAKFKHLRDDLGGDAYQLLAYLLAFGPSAGFLVSALGERSRRTIESAGKALHVYPVALDRPPEDVLAQVAGLAEEALTQ